MVIECLPTSLCSWDFSVRSPSLGPTTVAFDWLTEQGRISADKADYDIRKHGLLSGRWTLNQKSNVVAEAHKPSALHRSFEITGSSTPVTLQAESPMTRTFAFIVDGQVIGSIRPTHAFTRRATIECEDVVPETIQLFAFWLAVITWRRSANGSSGASS